MKQALRKWLEEQVKDSPRARAAGLVIVNPGQHIHVAWFDPVGGQRQMLTAGSTQLTHCLCTVTLRQYESDGGLEYLRGREAG